MGEVIAFFAGAVVGCLATCLIAAGRRDGGMMEMSRYLGFEYRNIQNASIKQQNVARYPEYGYDCTQNRNSAADLIRAQGEQIRHMTAEEYLREKMRSDADGHNKGTASGIPE